MINSNVRSWSDVAATFLRELNIMTENKVIEWINRIYIYTNQPDKCIALKWQYLLYQMCRSTRQIVKGVKMSIPMNVCVV